MLRPHVASIPGQERPFLCYMANTEEIKHCSGHEIPQAGNRVRLEQNAEGNCTIKDAGKATGILHSEGILQRPGHGAEAATGSSHRQPGHSLRKTARYDEHGHPFKGRGGSNAGRN
jgi:hypothetical protein